MRRAHLALQLVVAVVGWLVLGVGWWFVASSRPLRSDSITALLALALAAAVALLITEWWVGYNKGVYRRKGPRSGVPRIIYDFSKDATGVPVVADFAALKGERFVVISPSAGEPVSKVYSAGSAELTEEEVAACSL